MNYFEESMRANADRMRRNPTEAEAIFQARLSKGKLEVLNQVVIGRYIADFVVPEKMLIFELYGKVHSDPRKRRYDRARTEFLNKVGFKVIRIGNGNAATYPLKTLKNKPQAKRAAFLAALQKAKELTKDYAEGKNRRRELRLLDENRERALKAHKERKPVILKGYALSQP